MRRSASETEAANGALRLLRQPPLASLETDQAAAIAVRSAFADVRDALLREKDWNFASAWVKPAREAARALGPFPFRFPMPEDCLAVREVDGLAEDGWAIAAPTVPAGEQPTIAMLLATGMEAPSVRYTRVVEHPVLWDGLFLAVFQRRLGAEIAPLIAKSAEIATDLLAQADERMRAATTADAREKARGTVSRNTSWLRARGIVGGPPFRHGYGPP